MERAIVVPIEGTAKLDELHDAFGCFRTEDGHRGWVRVSGRDAESVLRVKIR
jgi:hypothetical protein